MDLVLHYTFHETLKIQVQAFKKGFNAIFPISSLSPFLSANGEDEQIERVICGVRCDAWSNQDELRKYIKPAHGFTHKSDMYNYFIRYILE